MELSVILASYNGGETLPDQFDGLAEQEWSEPWEIIFIDNGSTDNTRAIAEQYQQRLPNLKIIDASEKKGKPFALNKGIRASKGRALAFIDDDDQVAPGWLSAMGTALQTHDLVACRWDIDTLNSGWVRRARTTAVWTRVTRLAVVRVARPTGAVRAIPVSCCRAVRAARTHAVATPTTRA